MARCRYCKAKVSYQAKACPKCGCPNPGRSSTRHEISESYSVEETPAYVLFCMIVTITSLISAYVGWKDGGFWEAGKYCLLGGSAGLIVGYVAMVAIPDQLAAKINIVLSFTICTVF